jgi:superfamily II DNA or RNA helicase
VSSLQLITDVLREAQAPMSAREIADRAGPRITAFTRSRTPWTVISRDLALDALRGRASRVRRVAAGRFELVAAGMAYEELIARKAASIAASGINPGELAAHLFPHQRDLVTWALRRGRAAIFADTGLGKTACFIEWARHVSARGRVLVLAPLACGPQHEAEAARFGVPARYLRDDDGESAVVLTNYEIVHRFDPSDFVGVVLDESSILKSFDGKTKARLCDAFRETPFKLACTATPAPNDFTELGNHSEFLGLKTRSEMLAEFFAHDGGSTNDWRIKGHAIDAFWRWVASWAAVVSMPSDLGHDDAGYALPPLHMSDRVVAAPAEARALCQDGVAATLTQQRAVRRATLRERGAEVVQLVQQYAKAGDQAIVWCDLNDEQDAIAEALGDLCVSIEGATDDDRKVERHERWRAGMVSCLVSKAAIFGYGLNWQHCRRIIFAGVSHSYERTYQAIRRCWRFGQQYEVTVDIVRSDLDDAVSDNYRRKERDHARMKRAMKRLVGAIVRAEVTGLAREFNPYRTAVQMEIPSWLKTTASTSASITPSTLPSPQVTAPRLRLIPSPPSGRIEMIAPSWTVRRLE